MQPNNSPTEPVADALRACQGFHVRVLALMGASLWARAASGRLLPNARASLGITAVLWRYVTVQGLLGMAVIYLMPLA